MWAQPEIDLPAEVVQHAKDAPFSGVLPARSGGIGGSGGGGMNSMGPGPPGMMAPHQRQARLTGPISGGGGGPEGMVAGGAGAGSLQLPHQQQMPMPMQMQQGPQFDGPPGFLFEIESQVRPHDTSEAIPRVRCIS